MENRVYLRYRNKGLFIIYSDEDRTYPIGDVLFCSNTGYNVTISGKVFTVSHPTSFPTEDRTIGALEDLINIKLQDMKKEAKEEEKAEEYNHTVKTPHYNQMSIEVFDMMEAIWGKKALMQFCEMNAFKYRMRLGIKPDQPIQRDLDKIEAYLNKYKKLKASSPQDDEDA